MLELLWSQILFVFMQVTHLKERIKDAAYQYDLELTATYCGYWGEIFDAPRENYWSCPEESPRKPLMYRFLPDGTQELEMDEETVALPPIWL